MSKRTHNYLTDFFRSHTTGLIARMTFYVACAVALVCGIILYLASNQLTSLYSRQLRKQLNESMEATVSLVDQCMKRVQYATQTAALQGKDDAQFLGEHVDSLLTRTLRGMEFSDFSMIIYEEDFFPQYKGKGHYERGAFYTNPEHKEIAIAEDCEFFEEEDENWTYSYIEGRHCLSMPYAETLSGDTLMMVCYSVPLTDKDGRRYGIFCTNLTLDWLAKTVKKLNLRPEISVGIYSAIEEGDTVLNHSPQIEQLKREHPDQIIEETRILPDIDWVIRMAVPLSAIDTRVDSMLHAFMRFALLLFLTTTIAVALVVRFIGKPFVETQQKTETARLLMQRDLDIAAKTQHYLVPHAFPPFPERSDIDLHACLYPAQDIGGDLYDYFIHEEHLYFCIGDVSGKGVPASFFMGATHYLFRSVASSLPIADAVRQINRSLCVDNEQCMFVTFWFGCLDLVSGELQYVNAGHNAPILISDKGATFLPNADDMPLGVWEEAEFTSRSLTLGKGEMLLLYTDGVTESMNTENKELGDAATLSEAEACKGLRAEEVIEKMLNRVRSHAQGMAQSDDITLVALRVNP